MKPTRSKPVLSLVRVCVALAGFHLAAATLYVSPESPHPSPPYTDWATAARVIQDAVDAAQAGDEILVTNGVYATGGRAVGGTMTNRVGVDRPLTLRSVNGPRLTVIQGYQLPGHANGIGAIRGVYLADGAALSGFTITRGATRDVGPPDAEGSGGGVWCHSTLAFVTNCVLTCNSAGYGGGVRGGTVSHCELSSNQVANSGGWALGGGAWESVLNDCLLRGNSASFGGGAGDSTLNRCTLEGNSATGAGGGTTISTLNNCVLSQNNSYNYGGGSDGSTLNDCILTNNLGLRGGGASGGVLNRCLLIRNEAGGDDSGAAAGCTLNHCVLIGNTAHFGGIVSESTLNNCIVAGNQAFLNAVIIQRSVLRNSIVYHNEPANRLGPGSTEWLYCCTTPLPAAGTGNITNAPLFVDLAAGDLRLQSSSPCINAGNNAFVSGETDFDGLPRIIGGTVDIGAYEFQTPSSRISYAWLQQYGLPTDGSADTTDPDRDGLNTWQEWRCLTDPTDARSVLRLLSATPFGADVRVSWLGIEGVSYFLERSTNLGAVPPFTPLARDLPGTTGTNTFTDTREAILPGGFYRVGVAE